MIRSRTTPWRSRRPGSILSAEFVLILPLVLAVTAGFFEFSVWLTVQEQVAAASREGARVAATGGSDDGVKQAVLLNLGPVELPQANIQTIWLREGTDETSPIRSVVVVVTLPADKVVPDLLPLVGFSLSGRVIIGQTLMQTEF